MKNILPSSLVSNVSRKYAVLLVAWTILGVGSLWWSLYEEKQATLAVASSIARANIANAIHFRHWVAAHGGVYVPPTDKTPSNPYLVHPDRDVVTTTGKSLTLLNPAYALRDFQNRVPNDDNSESHITSLNPVNPDNAADAWEAAALRQIENGAKEVTEVQPGGVLKMMAPLMVEPACLQCHANQGYKLGDIRGGISSNVSLAGFYKRERIRLALETILHSLIWALGVLGGVIFFRRERRLLDEQAMSHQQVAESEVLFRNYFELGQVGMCVTSHDLEWLRVNRRLCEMLGYTAAELVRMKWTELTHPDDLELDLVQFKKLLAGEVDSYELDKRFIRKDGSILYTHLNVSCQRMADGSLDYVIAALDDITDRKKADEEIKYLAFYDPLTGLANRRLMTDRMTQHLAHARRSGELVAVCMIDLDGFKQVNDQMGHKAGDALLIEVAKRLQENLRQSDTASRFGGDEFALILGEFKKISECEQSLTRIIASLAAPYSVNGQIAHVTASVGATIFPNDGGTPDLLLRHADQSMYEAKQAGKNCYRLFNPSHQNQQLSNQAMLDKIGKALGAGQFELFYQPQVDCRRGKVVSVEALIRWNHPILGLLNPSEFIPLLEHDDLIIKLGEWVIQEALKQQVEWRRVGFDLSISINIAARQLHQSNFVMALAEIIAAYDTDVVSRITIEIVETAVLEDIPLVAEAIRRCRDLGIHVAIDDFGTGFSSLAHLKHLRVDELKIDKSFVLGMLHNPEDMAIVNGVIGLASSFKHRVIAEGVESIDHILMLLEMGCDIMQGYIIARPMTGEQFAVWLNKFAPDPLWSLSSSQRPSRDYFELLLAETNHRHWIDDRVAEQRDKADGIQQKEFLDYQQCRLGQWYYGEGTRRLGKEEWFNSIGPLHQSIHQIALRVSELQCNGETVQAEAAAAQLQREQDKLDALLKQLRGVLAHEYLETEPKK